MVSTVTITCPGKYHSQHSRMHGTWSAAYKTVSISSCISAAWFQIFEGGWKIIRKFQNWKEWLSLNLPLLVWVFLFSNMQMRYPNSDSMKDVDNQVEIRRDILDCFWVIDEYTVTNNKCQLNWFYIMLDWNYDLDVDRVFLVMGPHPLRENW